MARIALILLLGTPLLLAAQPVGSWLLLEIGEAPLALLVALGVMVVAASIGGILLGRKAARSAFAMPSGHRHHHHVEAAIEAKEEEEESASAQRKNRWDFLAHPKVASNYDRWNEIMEQRSRAARAQRANSGVQ
jgi:hypothetical protein